VLDFMRLLWAIDHGLSSASKRMDATSGVTGPQRLVIRIVGRVPGISAGDIAGLMHVHPSTLTGVLDRLERRGVLKRKVDPTDGRRALFSLTERGQEIDARRHGTIEAKVRAALAKLPEARVAATREVLESLATALAPRRARERALDPRRARERALDPGRKPVRPR
jgi:MarR family transcriptional regulator, organic hydroperoxide resistance regulator